MADRDPFERLEEKADRAFPNLRKARELTGAKGVELTRLLGEQAPSDTSIVVFGSLARGEYTAGSDVDWTLLIDGQADEGHYAQAAAIGELLKKHGFGAPGPTGVFGNVAFSHPILHQIGGQEDTNKITTQRILLLLESLAIGKDEAYERVLGLILTRYIEDDRGIRFSRSPELIPKFLLNDIVRYWRTVTVDFVSKQRERSDGWALRNAKLRMSRKLIFVSGLLTCFSLARHEGPAPWLTADGTRSVPDIVAFLRDQIRIPPLRHLAEAALAPCVSPATARELFEAYDAFLAVLDDKGQRDHLKKLSLDDLGKDAVFRHTTDLGRSFQTALDRLVWDEDQDLARLLKLHGVF